VFKLTGLVRALTAVVSSRHKKVEARGPLSRGEFLRSLWK